MATTRTNAVSSGSSGERAAHPASPAAAWGTCSVPSGHDAPRFQRCLWKKVWTSTLSIRPLDAFVIYMQRQEARRPLSLAAH
jgi:hypothetical protein